MTDEVWINEKQHTVHLHPRKDGNVVFSLEVICHLLRKAGYQPVDMDALEADAEA